MAFTKLTPQGFAALTAADQRSYQVSEAQDIFSRAINQDKTVTQSEIDFAQRILGKTIPESITPTGYGNIAQGVGELADSVGSGLGSFQWKVYAPIFVLGIVVIGVLLAFNKAKSAN